MYSKKLAIQSISDLPDDASWEDIKERIRFCAAIERGRQDIRDGNVIPHDEVKQNLEQWLTA